MKNRIISTLFLPLILLTTPAHAAEYRVDPSHSFVEFRIQHLGYSWLYGRFNDIKGSLNYDAENPSEANIQIDVDPASIDTNHAERDKHLRSDDFLDVKKFPNANFTSTAFHFSESGSQLEGTLTIHGVSKPVTIAIKKIGEGSDPWGGYRAGFEGSMNLNRSEFDLGYNLGPASETIEFRFGIEAILE